MPTAGTDYYFCQASNWIVKRLTATQELGGFPEGKQDVMDVFGETIFDPVPTCRELERISQLEGWMLWLSWTSDTYCSGMVALYGSHMDFTFIKEGQSRIWKSEDGLFDEVDTLY
jgi:hypothetical protein